MLGPCLARWWDPAWAGLCFPVVWDATDRLPPSLRVPPAWPNQRPDPAQAIARDPGARRLLALLFAAVFVEPELVRHLRLALPPGLADVGSEAAAWLHPDVRRGELALVPGDGEAIERLRDAWAEVSRAQRDIALDLIGRAHLDETLAVRMEERANRAALLGIRNPAVERFMDEVRRALEDPRRRIRAGLVRRAPAGHRAGRVSCKHPLTPTTRAANPVPGTT